MELWARGLQSLAGGEEEGEGTEEEEAVSGGLAFTVGGARTRSLSLFESQVEWTSCIEGLRAEEEEAVSGGLAITVGGARTSSLSLFERQVE